ncbi:Peptidylprolyl isomerase [Mycena sanguinolenta]|uniref:peptidylprolyl isomerase n=1 Tax=Mycena sanguinolenta TaxID=230812 RepID=A0A8H7DCD6_9AGAR|nr:Peptidylprolyl isomerase [Mycena sanguinolenta]
MGVTVDISEHGDGATFPKKNDTVIIHYDGFIHDANKPGQKGDKFDSSRDRNDPFKTEICVGKVIKGWDEGIPQLSKGSKARLTITPDYGYGARGFPPVIPPNSTLIFEVELLDIK